MKKAITQSLIETAKPKSKAYEIRDTKVSGFLVRVQPSGRKTYYCEYRRGARVKIGLFQTLSTKQARTQAQEILAKYFRGEDPAKERKDERACISYGDFLETYYFPWVNANLRTAYEYRRVLNVNCRGLMKTRLNAINRKMIEKWRMGLLAEGKSANTVNRVYTNLRASLSKAEEWELLEEHPLRKMKPLKTPQTFIVRYLEKDEEVRLREALDAREARKRVERYSGNAWRAERGYPLYPGTEELTYMDHIKPMVLLSMNTGMRQGEVFKLKWTDVNFNSRHITVTGHNAKNGKIRYIPLNTEAFDVLTKWADQSTNSSEYVFANKDGRPFDNIKKGWAKILKAAEIKGFRWHDLRHHFASKLVMAGVNLNTVRELLGHSSYAMTLRYAHLSAGHKAEAVELLISKVEIPT